jgi:hypothetical protein
VLAALAKLEAVEATALAADIGIQYHLATLAGEGQLPVRDFEHGWNVLSWWMQSGCCGCPPTAPRCGSSSGRPAPRCSSSAPCRCSSGAGTG